MTREKLLALAVALCIPFLAVPACGEADYQQLVDEAYAKFKDNDEGANANYIPALDEVDSSLFAVVVVTREGDIYAAGDADHSFSIQSVAKPFTAALVMQAQGVEAIQQKIGVEPTGMPFNSIIAIELNEQRSRNPLVNAGAIAAVSMIDAKDADEQTLMRAAYGLTEKEAVA